MKPSEVLAKAADLIEPEGAWTQGAFGRDANGDAEEDSLEGGDFLPVCLCLYGGIHVACGEAYDADSHSDDYGKWLRPAIGLQTAFASAVAEWNDAPERTQAEVVKALRDAADLARAEGQ